jgi:hypothetical protein
LELAVDRGDVGEVDREELALTRQQRFVPVEPPGQFHAVRVELHERSASRYAGHVRSLANT